MRSRRVGVSGLWTVISSVEESSILKSDYILVFRLEVLFMARVVECSTSKMETK